MERRAPAIVGDLCKTQRVSLPFHPDDDVAEPLPVVEPFPDKLDLLRCRLALRVDECEVGGRGRKSLDHVVRL
jgi:hypothetical protein